MLQDDLEPSTREFASAAERDSFVAESVSDPEPLDTERRLPLLGCGPPLGELHGETLTAVYFVRDYFQLVFDDRHTSFYTWPIVSRNDSESHEGQAGYRDALCGFIGDEVIGTDILLDEGAVIEFSTGRLRIPPDVIRSSAVGPEIVYGDGGAIMAGDLPFD